MCVRACLNVNPPPKKKNRFDNSLVEPLTSRISDAKTTNQTQLFLEMIQLNKRSQQYLLCCDEICKTRIHLTSPALVFMALYV